MGILVHRYFSDDIVLQGVSRYLQLKLCFKLKNGTTQIRDPALS